MHGTDHPRVRQARHGFCPWEAYSQGTLKAVRLSDSAELSDSGLLVGGDGRGHPGGVFELKLLCLDEEKGDQEQRQEQEVTRE